LSPRISIFVITICGSLLLAGPAQQAPAANAPKKPAPPQARPTVAKKPRMSDPDLERAIRAKLGKSKIAADKFEVRVQGGIATLDGRTDVVQHKGTATRLAKGAGAVQVVNRIQVSQAAKDKAAANLAKGRRRAQVKRSQTESAQPQKR
jgi:hypothetical protein